LVEYVYQRSHESPVGLLLMAKSKKLQERPLEVQSNSQGALGYMPPPKESLSRYIKLLKPGK